jgi:hypothetical protein
MQMAMPPQLARARRPKRYQPRALFETLPALDARMLARRRLFPGNSFDWHRLDNFGLIVPQIRSLRLCRRTVEIVHLSGYQQTIAIHWQRISGATHSQRPVFICTNCKHRAFKLYSVASNFVCRKCTPAIYSSQVCDRQSRPALQHQRLKQFLGPRKPPLMHRRTFNRLMGKLRQLEARTARRTFHSKRLSDYRTQKPLTVYRTQLQANP